MKITMKNEKIIKVLVADNSEFAKNNLRDFLESSEGIQLINVVDNGKDAYHFIMDEAPDRKSTRLNSSHLRIGVCGVWV